MSQSVQDHKSGPVESIRIGVVTISDTRTLETDRGGSLIIQLIDQAGHEVVRREIIPDEPDAMRLLLSECAQQQGIQAVLMTGGTGISNRDQTYETVTALLSLIHI